MDVAGELHPLAKAGLLDNTSTQEGKARNCQEGRKRRPKSALDWTGHPDGAAQMRYAHRRHSDSVPETREVLSGKNNNNIME